VSAVRCRLATPADLPALLELETAAFAAVDRFPRAAWRRMLTSPSALVLVVREGGACLGAIAWLLRRTSAQARMYSLAVAPQARGRGLAQALFAASLRRLPARIQRLSLEVRASNLPARTLYERLGFQITCPLPGYYDDGGDGVRMQRARAGGP
jgi:ribosomal protein S18 acetylase RimI-like enzyme